MFNNFFKLTNTLLFGICSILLLMGCQPIVDQSIADAPTIETIVSEQAVVLQNTVTAVPTSSISQTSTAPWTPIPTIASSSTLPPTQTPLPSATMPPTLWPTLSPDEAARTVLTLLEDNQNPNCLLPCWWGATPGQTLWPDVEPFLRSFVTKIDETSIGASAKLPIPEPVAVPGFSYYVSYSWDESRTISGISVTPINVPGYDPKTMLTLYGVPDEVWLKTFSELLPGEVLPFQLIIVYQEQGISFRYYVNAAENHGMITACFEPGVVETERPDLFPVGPTIRTWIPGHYRTIEEIVRISQETYFPLEEKTDFTPEKLYEKFNDPNEKP